MCEQATGRTEGVDDGLLSPILLAEANRGAVCSPECGIEEEGVDSGGEGVHAACESADRRGGSEVEREPFEGEAVWVLLAEHCKVVLGVGEWLCAVACDDLPGRGRRRVERDDAAEEEGEGSETESRGAPGGD